MTLSTTQDKFYVRPGTLDDAIEIAAQDGVSIMAGGTSLIKSARKTGWSKHRTVLDISGAVGSGLDMSKGFLSVGAMAVCSDIASWKLPNSMTALSEAAGTLASTPLRNLITLGGNVIQTFPWSCLPVAFLAIGGNAVLACPSKGDATVTKIAADQLFESHPLKTIGKNSIVTAFEFEGAVEQCGASAFEKISMTTFEYPIASAAALIKTSHGIISLARVVVGGILPLPRRFPEIEEAVMGLEPISLDAKSLSKAVVSRVEATPLPGGFSREYRTEMAGLAVARSVIRAALAALGSHGQEVWAR